MTPAERLAALRAIKEGLDSAIKEAERAVTDAMGDTGADRYRTDLGPVIKASRRPSVVFDDAKLLAYAEAVADWEIETIRRVRPTFRDQFQAMDGEIIYKPTGEAVDVGTVKTGSDYLTVRLTDDAKADARQAIMERADAVVNLLAIEGD